jgi:hypothetical protein
MDFLADISPPVYGEEKRRIEINSGGEKALLENSQVTGSVSPRTRFLVHISELPPFSIFPLSLPPSLDNVSQLCQGREEKRIKAHAWLDYIACETPYLRLLNHVQHALFLFLLTFPPPPLSTLGPLSLSNA